MAIQAEKLAGLLREDGLQVETVRTNPLDSGNGRLAATIPGVRTVFNLAHFMLNLRKALKQCEVVYFFSGFVNFFFWVTYPALLLIKLYRKPVILSARGGDARRFFMKYKKLVFPVLRKVDLITTPSGFLQNVFKETLGLEPTVVPNIADIKQFEFILRKKFRPRLLCTRNLEIIYGVDCVIRAFQFVAEKYPDAHLGIAGEGSQRRYLEQLAHDLCISDRITFYGQLGHSGIQKLYHKYDIYVNASQVDNQPGVVLEAFASGLPMVSTNAGGIPYMVENEKTGLLSSVGDHEALAQNVLRVIQEPGLGEALAQAGLSETDKYTWEYVRPLMSEVFEEVGRSRG
ncbi:MAG: glycosyltransferase family 4 protein [Desulfurivibrionaceae bacterium]